VTILDDAAIIHPPLRVGVIGLGWAGQQHLAAYSALPDVTVVAIAGKETELGARLASEYAVPQVFEDWEDLVALEGLDAVSVAVPTFLHAPIAIAALQRGLHVLSEKPIARTGDEGQLMVDAARRAGRVLDVAFNHRRRGDIQALRAVIASGDIGEPYHARASWMRRRGIPKLGSWFTNREMAGGGPLADIGVHVIDYALHLLGEPTVVSVTAASYAALGPRGLGGDDRPTADASTSAFEVEDFVSAFLRLSTGVTLVLETSWAAYRDPADLMDFSVLATDGGAELSVRGGANPLGELRVFRDVDGEEADYTVTAEEGRAHRAVVDDFIAVVRDPALWAENDGSLALGRARIIDACYRSAAEGREVML
jgi:predicted dehydrogenase